MPDEIKRLQNELVSIYQADKDCGPVPEDSEIIAAYEAAIEALEKQIPQKIIERSKEVIPGEFRHWEECPSCHTEMEYEWGDEPYCPHCGHAVDWSEVEE